MPDVNACYHGKEFWVELKILRNDKVKISPQQVAWHTRRSSTGGLSWVLIEDPDSKELITVTGNQTYQLITKGLSSCESKRYTRPIDWRQLLQQLCLTDYVTD